MKNDYVICPAEASDAAGIAAIELECFSEPWSENAVLSEMRTENGVFVVCRNASGVCGYGSGRDNYGEFYVNNIAVTAQARRNGIGEALLLKLVSDVEKRGCDFLTLEVRASNHAARRLYEKCGLSEVGLRRGFYRSPTEDAVLYTIYFNQSEKNQ